MFGESFGKFERQEYSSSDAFDILLAWGCETFTSTWRDRDESSLSEIWRDAQRKGYLEEMLARGLERFQERMEGALEFLNGPALPDACYDDSQRVVEALETLDGVSMLLDTIGHFPEPEALGNEFRATLDHLLLEATVEDTPSGLRLTPLNGWRRQKLEDIPVDRHYLFPWYELWSELPEDTLARLVEAWSDLERGSGTVEGIKSEDLTAIFGELENDLGLLEWIREKADISERTAHD